jgi:nitroimidazol reductase NimA-like FMN-containing flavoprotein (pyridoxamine 5'-phosphate oxidase superfamily)
LPDSPAPAGPPSDRVRLRRKRERGSYDRAVIDEILDEALIAHLGILDAGGQPIVIPTLHARSGDLIYLHGSSASRTLQALQMGAPACLTVSLIDGLVLARSAMHHSVNYRSVMLFGGARSVTDPREKRAALEAVIEHIVPGRWPTIRQPTENELRATAVLSMAITEVSAKIRNGEPVDDEEDYSLDAWAGVIPLRQMAGEAQPDPRMPANIAIPAHVAQYNTRSTAPPDV